MTIVEWRAVFADGGWEGVFVTAALPVSCTALRFAPLASGPLVSHRLRRGSGFCYVDVVMTNRELFDTSPISPAWLPLFWINRILFIA